MFRWFLAALLGVCIAVGVIAAVRSAPPVTDLNPRKVVLVEKDHTLLECIGRTCTTVGLARWHHLYWDIPANKTGHRVAWALKRPDGTTHTTYNRRPGAQALTFSVGWQVRTRHPMFIFARGEQVASGRMPTLVWSLDGTLRLPHRGTWYVSAWIDHCWSSPCPKATSFTYKW